MKTIKKTMAALLAMVMMLSVMAMPVSAAELIDVESGQWYTGSVERWLDAALLAGYEDGTFKPDAPITRAEVASIMYRMLGLSYSGEADDTFADVDVENAWYGDDVLACYEAGIIYGNDDGTYAPDAYITREAAFSVIVRALKLTDYATADVTVLNPFSDKADVSSWAQTSMALLVGTKAVTGYPDGTLKPLNNITRAEFAKILDRLVGVYVNPNGEISKATDEDTYSIVGSLIIVNASTENVVQVGHDGEGNVTVTVKNENGDPIGEAVTVTPDEEVTEELPVVIVTGDNSTTVDPDSDVCVDPDGGDDEDVFDEHETIEVPCTNCAVARDSVIDHCDICGDEVLDTEPAHPHTFVDGVCTCCGMDLAAALKFQLRVTSNEQYVDATVTNDYTALITVTPGQVDAGKITLYAAMQNVGSLGVDELREHEQTFETGLTGDPELATWLSNVFAYHNGTVNVSIEGAEKFAYNLSGAKDEETGIVQITAAPDSVEAARAAWQALTSHVETGTQEADSRIVIANGSFLLIGGEILCFEKNAEGDLVLDNFGDLSAMSANIRAMVQAYAKESNDSVVAHLAAGTTLAISSSYATLKDDATITVTSNVLKDEDVAGILSKIKNAEGGYAMASELVTLLNTLVGKMDNGATMDVVIDFETPVEKNTKFYLGLTANNADGNGTTTVDVEVYDDYSLEINLPMNNLSAAEISATVEMTDVASLGVSGTKSHTITVDTGLTANGDLNHWMSNAKTFEDATIVANINGKSVTYTLTSDMDPDWVTITGTADTDAARAAWQELMKAVSTSTQETDDSYIVIDNTSYLTVGGETLQFEEGAEDLELAKGSADLDNMGEKIKAAVCVVDAEAGVVEAKIGAGTTLAVGQSIATCNTDVTVSVSGLTITDGVLSQLRDNADNTYNLIQTLFTILNDAVGSADKAETITVDINFTVAE